MNKRKIFRAILAGIFFFPALSYSSDIISKPAPENWLEMKKAEKISELEKNYAAEASSGARIIRISGGHYGELWKLSGGKAAALETWSLAEINPVSGAARAGKWFASFGVRRMGGDYPNNGLNLRLGTMLYKNKYDLSLSWDYNRYSDSDSASKTLGLSVRRLMPLTPHTGCNLGVKISRSDYYGDASTDLSGVAGLNFYLPGGSFDISYDMGEEGRWGVTLGYTVFIGG